MPSVADELAALRAKGGVKARAAGIGKGSLSTPEAEAAALRAKKDKDKFGKANAKEILSKGGSGSTSQELEHTLQQNAKKKALQDKTKTAKEILSKGGSGGVNQELEHTLQQKATKKAEMEKVNQAKMSLSRGSLTSPKSAAATTEMTNNATVPQAPKEKEATNVNVAATKVEDDDDDVPDLEEADDVPELEGGNMDNIQQTSEEAESRQISNRNEKKARKMMQRLGMNPVQGIERATFKTGGQGGYFFIDKPDVYSLAGGKGSTYVIFGEAKQGGNMQQQQAAMAQAQAQAAMAQQQQAAGMMPSVAEEGVEIEELTGEGAVDESGVEAKDIDLIMSQGGCSRAAAVKALKENDNDLVNAIMSLTT